MPVHDDVPYLATALALGIGESGGRQYRESDQSSRRCEAMVKSSVGQDAGNPINRRWSLVVGKGSLRQSSQVARRKVSLLEVSPHSATSAVRACRRPTTNDLALQMN